MASPVVVVMVPVPGPYRLIDHRRGRIVNRTRCDIHRRGRQIRRPDMHIRWCRPNRVDGRGPAHMGRMHRVDSGLRIDGHAMVVAVIPMMTIM